LPGAELCASGTAVVGVLQVLVRAALRSIPAGILALAIGVALKLGGPFATDPAHAGWQGGDPVISVYGTIHPKLIAFRPPLGSQLADTPGVQVASLGPAFGTDGAVARDPEPEGLSFDQRFFFHERLASFDERFGGAGASGAKGGRIGEDTVSHVLAYAAPATDMPRGIASVRASRVPTQVATQVASVGSLPPVPRARPASSPAVQEASLQPVTPDTTAEPDIGSKTAIYDIAAHTVYLPNGQRLEAHSGLGSHMDDARYISLRMRGPTPPNVYTLSLREELFHGVRALRLNPVDESKMHGRAGMLAHSYMLGPNGQSNGCVSFSDYPAFLKAYLNGEVDRLVVVERLAGGPPTKTASGWLPEAISKLFKSSEGTAGI
jgi:hypothetical protein